MRKTGELIQGLSAYRVPILQRYCICMIQFLSSHATDPHRYFELKLTGKVLDSDSQDELTALLRNLLDWVDSMGAASSQFAHLEELLAAENLPSFSSLRVADEDEIRKIFLPTQN
jgi:hypothetical protein